MERLKTNSGKCFYLLKKLHNKNIIKLKDKQILKEILINNPSKIDELIKIYYEKKKLRAIMAFLCDLLTQHERSLNRIEENSQHSNSFCDEKNLEKTRLSDETVKKQPKKAIEDSCPSPLRNENKIIMKSCDKFEKTKKEVYKIGSHLKKFVLEEEDKIESNFSLQNINESEIFQRKQRTRTTILFSSFNDEKEVIDEWSTPAKNNVSLFTAFVGCEENKFNLADIVTSETDEAD